MTARYLVHIPFTSTSKLVKGVYQFKYRGHEFKIVRTRKTGYADNLLAIVDSEQDIPSLARVAAEFFSALAWASHGAIHFGQPTWARNGRVAELKQARPCIFDFDRIPPGRTIGGYSLSSIPYIETEHQRRALSVFREANAANNQYLQFLFYWQVLDIGSGDAIGAANKAYRAIKDRIWLDRIDLRGKSVGNYFYGDCRNAIAHIVRRPNETVVDFDDLVDRARISLSVKAIERLARFHIEHRLKLTKDLHLHQCHRGSVPEYLRWSSEENLFVQPSPPSAA